MRGQKVSLYWGGILFLLFAAMILFGLRTQGNAQNSQENSKVLSIAVTIDTMAEHGALELPPVTFFHDKHAEAVKDEKQPCLACHNEDKKDKQLDFTFRNTAEVEPEEMKDAFHDNCMGCHEEYQSKGKESGPLEGECRSCHSEKPVSAVRQSMGFDKVLHYRHIAAKEIPKLDLKDQEDENCGQCHHTYDLRADKLVPETKEEGSCRYCHEAEPYKLEDTDVTVRTLPKASHLQCVNCHRDLRVADTENKGPEKCMSCHGTMGQDQVQANNEKVLKSLDNELPRLERGQPDAALITAIESKSYLALHEDERPRTIFPVPFNHIDHERSSDNCRTCHHQEIKSCNSCHTLKGDKDGNFVQISDAMHMRESDKSCIGCHGAKKREPVCAGCHSNMEVKELLDEKSCSLCHQDNLPDVTDVLALPMEEQNAIAKSMLETRPMKPGLYSEDEIPEKVTVNAMADEYKPAEFPHRRIVLYLAEEVGKSEMGGYFHGEQGLLCQGCHHNSPVSSNPPSCMSCHGKPFDENTQGRPGLKAAYHGQCMGCHSAMNIVGKEIVKDKPVPANTDCKGCHAEKK